MRLPLMAALAVGHDITSRRRPHTKCRMGPRIKHEAICRADWVMLRHAKDITVARPARQTSETPLGGQFFSNDNPRGSGAMKADLRRLEAE